MSLTIRQALKEDIQDFCHLMQELTGYEISI
jgi:hypothetical protein